MPLILRLAPAAAAALLALPAAAQEAGEDALDLGEIVLLPAATPRSEARTGASVTVIDGEAIEAAGDLLLTDLLARQPGVSVASQGPAGTLSDVRIRGARNRYIAVYVDGILVNDPSAPDGAFADFGGLTTGAIDRVELLKGAQSALYGSAAVAGVLDVRTTRGRELGEGTFQEAAVEAGSFGTLGASYRVTRNAGPVSLSFAATSTRADGYSAADEDDGNDEADGFSRTRLSFDASYAVDAVTRVGVNGFVETGTTEYDGFDSATFAPADADNEDSRDAVGLRLYGAFEALGFAHETALSVHDVSRVSAGTDFESRRTQLTHVATRPLGARSDLSLGLDFRRETADYPNLPDDVDGIDILGTYAELAVTPRDDVDLLATVRVDDHETAGTSTTGRLAFAVQADALTTVRGAIATGFRAPSLDELYGDYPGAFAFVGNPDLDPEESLTAELGIDRRLAGGGEVSATLFRSEIENLITFTSGAGPDGASTLLNIPGTSVRYGLELSGEVPVGDRVTAFGAATLIEAESAAGDPLPRVPESDLVLGAEVTATDRLTLRGSLKRVGSYVDGGEERDAFTVARAGATYDLTEDAALTVRVENLFDEEYQVIPGYGTSDRAVYVGLSASF